MTKHKELRSSKVNEERDELKENNRSIFKLDILNYLKHHKKGDKMMTEMERERMLKDWFHALDADGGGGISVDELEEPLISIGLVSSREDLVAMIDKYDSSGDGEIDFQEFVKMVMTREEGGNGNAMLRLFEAFSDGKLGDPLLPFSTLVHMYSRKQLFKAFMGKDEAEKAEGISVVRARMFMAERIKQKEVEEQQKMKDRAKNTRRSSLINLKEFRSTNAAEN
jgi:Ca2+-binding EF-hand superfamily protein